MKLNLNYYKKDIIYDKNYNLEDEKKVKAFFDKEHLEDKKVVYKTNEDWKFVEAVSNFRRNLLSWYGFKENSSLLEIGAGFGELTGLFCEKCKNVVSVEFSKTRGEIIKNRWEEKNNLEVIIGNLKDIHFNEKFDYVTLIGSFNYAEFLMGEGKDSYLALLDFAKELLNENGTILIATDNSFGIKYLSGEKSEHTDKIYGTLTNSFDNSKLFTKKELCEFVEKAGLKKQRFYYPLPNYKLPNVVFSEEYLPEKSLSKLDYYIYYNENAIVNKSEIDVIKQLNNNDLFADFCNSYLLEVSKSNNTNNNIRFASFNNMRKDKYNLMLKINDDNIVSKGAISKKGIKHIKNCIDNVTRLKEMGFNTFEYENNGEICSKYQKNDTLDKVILKKIEEKKVDEVYKIIDKWFNLLKEKFLKEKTEKKLNYVDEAYIDLVFENIFLIEDDFFIFDQEWKVEKIPLEFIFYRAIKNLYFYHNNIENILSEEELLKRYGLLESIETFQEIEKKFQTEVVDKETSEFFMNKTSGQFYNMEGMKNDLLKSIDIIKGKNDRIEEITKTLEEYIEEIKIRNSNLKIKQDEIDSLRNELNIYKSSRLIELIRRLRR